MDKNLKIYGKRPVLELIESGKEIDTIYLQKDLKSEWSNSIEKQAQHYNINIKIVPKYKLDRLTKKNHHIQQKISINQLFQFYLQLKSLIQDILTGQK